MGHSAKLDWVKKMVLVVNAFFLAFILYQVVLGSEPQETPDPNLHSQSLLNN